jgi:peptidoglycan/xylan/chitin deacetylase (PgdA/CDA1 family)
MSYPEPGRPSLLDEPALLEVRDHGVVLRRGRTDRPEAVRVIQRALCAFGLPVAVDGVFHGPMEAAVLRLQAQVGLPADGRVGPYTLHALHQALLTGEVARAAPPPPPPVRGLFGGDRFGDRVALTFDDGPHPKHTPRILDLLAAAHLPATFFVLGNRAEAQAELLRRIVSEGHSLGCHSWDHADLGRLPEAAVEAQLRDSARAIEAALGPPVEGAPPRPPLCLFRPPYGSPWFDASARRKERVGAVVARLGWSVILWSCDSRDWVHVGHPERIVEEARVSLRPGRGGVVLMHDIHPQTVEALPGLIALVAELGLTVVPLEALLDSKYGPPAPGAMT